MLLQIFVFILVLIFTVYRNSNSDERQYKDEVAKLKYGSKHEHTILSVKESDKSNSFAVIRMPFHAIVAFGKDCKIFDTSTGEILFIGTQGDYAEIPCADSRGITIEVQNGIGVKAILEVDIGPGLLLDVYLTRLTFFKYGLQAVEVEEFIEGANITSE